MSKPNDPRAGFRNQLLMLAQIVAEQQRSAQMAERETVFEDPMVVSALTLLDVDSYQPSGIDARTQAWVRELLYVEVKTYLIGKLDEALRLKLAKGGMTNAADASEGRLQ